MRALLLHKLKKVVKVKLVVFFRLKAIFGFKIASENSCRGFDHKTEAGPCNKPQTVLIFSGFFLYLKRENFSYKITDLHEVIPTMTDKNSRLVSELTSSIKEILGVNPDYVISPGTYDQKHIERIGKLKNCVAYGPGILDLAHQPDEYISVNDMLDSAKVMALSLEKMLI